jgi:hypothetical protein
VIPGVNPLILSHIILSSIAFCVFFPLAIFFAVFRFHPKAWFPLHVVFNVLGVACTIAGFVVIVIEVSDRNVNHFPALQDSPTQGTHPLLGLILLVMVLIQIALGAAANYAWRKQLLHHPERVHSPVVARIHQAWGRLTLITSIAEVFLGIRETLLDDWVYGVYGGFYGLLAVVVIAMHLIRPRHRWRTLLYHEKADVIAMRSTAPVVMATAVPTTTTQRHHTMHYGQPTEAMFDEHRVVVVGAPVSETRMHVYGEPETQFEDSRVHL